MGLANTINTDSKPTLEERNSSPLHNKVRQDFNYKEYYHWMNAQLTPRITSLAVALLGNPTVRKPTEWRWGQKGSLVVYMSGDKAGRFCDFETGAMGDALALAQYKTGYRGKELSDWVKEFIGHQRSSFEKRVNEAWTPLMPVPLEALEGNILQGLDDSFNRKGMVERGRYTYRDLEGRVLGYVVRFEGYSGKMTLPLTYCVNKQGHTQWRWKGMPAPRLPYGAELLENTRNCRLPILVVEGEKTCDAARSLFSDWTVLSWAAGSGSVHLTDWSCLKDATVRLWPDHDRAGLDCMTRLKAIAKKSGVQDVTVISLPNDTPVKWDLADSLPETWNEQILRTILES